MDFTRQTLAYAIMGGMVFTLIPWAILILEKRRRLRLRRRGIKRYGH